MDQRLSYLWVLSCIGAVGCQQALGLGHYKYDCPNGTVIDLDQDPNGQCPGGSGGAGATGATNGPGVTATTGLAATGSGTTVSGSSSSGIVCMNSWESDCGGTCVNLLTDPTNCNMCSISCNTTAGEICEAGGTNMAQCANVDWAQFRMPNVASDTSLHSAPNPMSYIDNGDGTVTDTVTHLVWQQVIDPTKLYSVTDAANYCAVTLSKTGLGGYHDWRAPSLVETFSLVDYDKPSPGPMINTTFFPNTPTTKAFWGGAHFVSFQTGENDSTGGGPQLYVRCVR